jgi:hypothetical protein
MSKKYTTKAKPIASDDPRRVPDEILGKALIASRGLVYLAADALGMDYSRFSHRISQSDYLKEMKRFGIERRLDIAEDKLAELTEDKNVTAILFILRTLGKSRGYDETPKVEIPEETKMQFDSLMTSIKNLQSKSASKDAKNKS